MATADTLKKVDIFINGRTYTVNCPSDEQPALERASSFINSFIQDIRRQAPQLPQEELLVLCALTLYEKAEQLQALQQDNDEAKALVDGMLTQIKNLT